MHRGDVAPPIFIVADHAKCDRNLVGRFAVSPALKPLPNEASYELSLRDTLVRTQSPQPSLELRIQTNYQRHASLVEDQTEYNG